MTEYELAWNMAREIADYEAELKDTVAMGREYWMKLMAECLDVIEDELDRSRYYRKAPEAGGNAEC